MMQDQMKQENEESSADPGTVEGGRWVLLSGLQSASGQRLNGKCGQVVGELNSDGRYPVMVDGKTKGIAIKPENLVTVEEPDLVQVVRISAYGETGSLPLWKVLLFPRQHSMFSKSGNAPVMNIIGKPIVVEKTKPQCQLHEQRDFDCQWATWFMIEPVSGFAPMQWQTFVGPVLVYRPGGLHFGNDDCDLLIEWFSSLLDNYPEEDFDYRQELTLAKFEEYKNLLIQVLL